MNEKMMEEFVEIDGDPNEKSLMKNGVKPNTEHNE